MSKKLKLIILIESIILLFLILYIIVNGSPHSNKSYGLLSPRVYEKILEPKSFLIVNYAPLRNNIESFIGKNNLTMSIYVENLRSGAHFAINERKGYPPASLNKVLTAIFMMKKVEDRELSLDSPVRITDRSNAFGTLYKAKENELPLRVLLEAMLKESDDTAFKTLNKLADNDDRQLIMSYLDYYSEESSDKTKPGEDYENGLVTPKSMYNLFSSLYLSTLLEPENSEYILSLLTDTSFDIKKEAELPDGVIVSQKFATKHTKEERYFHSCGIIYFNQSRMFYCIMTKDMENKSAQKLVGAIVHNIYYYVIDTRATLDYYKGLYDY